MARNPVMFVVEIGSLLTTFWFLRDLFQGDNIKFSLQITLWLWFTVLFANFAEAIAEARGKAQADTLRATKKDTPATRLRNGTEEDRLLRAATQRRHRPCSRRRDHARRRRGYRRRRLRERSRHHRRVRAGSEGARHRHPQRRHRRHSGRLRLVEGANHGRPRRDVPRPHDRARRRSIPPEDAERDCPDDPPGGTEHHLPDGSRHAAAIRRLRGRSGHHDSPRRAPGLSSADDDRRAALGDWHRRDGPGHSLQRAGDVRPSGRDFRRRRRPAARQDGHHHVRQPPGGGDTARWRRQPRGRPARCPALLPRRRNSGGQEHRCAGQSARRERAGGQRRPAVRTRNWCRSLPRRV